MWEGQRAEEGRQLESRDRAIKRRRTKRDEEVYGEELLFVFVFVVDFFFLQLSVVLFVSLSVSLLSPCLSPIHPADPISLSNASSSSSRRRERGRGRGRGESTGPASIDRSGRRVNRADPRIRSNPSTATSLPIQFYGGRSPRIPSHRGWDRALASGAIHREKYRRRLS